MVGGGAEGLRVEVGRRGAAWLAHAGPPEQQVQRDCDGALLGQLGGVQVGALLLVGAHRVSDDDGGARGIGVQVSEGEEITGDGGLVLAEEINWLHRDILAAVEVVCSERHVLRRQNRHIQHQWYYDSRSGVRIDHFE